MLTASLIPVLIAALLALNMGASGTAPSFAAAYSAGVIKRHRIPLLFGVLVMLGAVTAGDKVAKTIGSEILPAGELTTGMVSVVLFSVMLSLYFANRLGVPQSTSQSTVLALVGAALYLGRLQTVKLLWVIVPTWFFLPVLAFVVTYVFAKFFYFPAKKEGIVNVHHQMLRPVWRRLTIACSCYVAFSIGSNNVANAAGPLAYWAGGLFHFAQSDLGFLLTLQVCSVLTAAWFGIGSSLMGAKVMRTTGREIAEYGAVGSSFISFITATLLLAASLTRGIPTSLVQLNTAAILAVGIAREGARKTLTQTSMPKIASVWVIAPLFAFACAYLLAALADALGYLR